MKDTITLSSTIVIHNIIPIIFKIFFKLLVMIFMIFLIQKIQQNQLIFFFYP